MKAKFVGKIVSLVIALPTTILLLGACAASHAPGSADNSSTGVSATGLQAFQSGFYQLVTSQGCTECHGVSQSPLFAVNDVTSAYNAAKNFVDFTNPDASPFILYSGNGHCAAAPCSNTATEAQMKAVIEAWSTAEMASQSGGGGGGGGGGTGKAAYLTATMAVPTNIPSYQSSANPAVLKFDLSKLQLAVAALSGATLQVNIQMADPTEYKFSNPSITGASGTVTISGLHIYVGSSAAEVGSEDPNQGIYSTPVMTTINSSSQTTLTTQSLYDPSVVNVNGTNITYGFITIGFEKVQ